MNKIKLSVLLFLLAFAAFLFVDLAYFLGVFVNWDKVVFPGFLGKPLMFELSAVEQIKNSSLLVSNFFTSGNAGAVYFSPVLLFFASLSKIFGLSTVAGVVLTQIVLLLFFEFTAFFILKKHYTVKTTLFILIGLLFFSGTGSLLNFFIPASIDLWHWEINVLNMLKIHPQYLFYFSVYLLVLDRIAEIKKHTIADILFLNLCLLIFVFELPHLVFLFSAGFFLFQILLKNSFGKILSNFLKLFLIPLILAVLMMFWYQNQSGNNIWQDADFSRLPSFYAYFAGSGLLLVFAVLFLQKRDFNKLNSLQKFSFCLILSFLLLIYVPIPGQRIFGFGLFLPLLILASEEILTLIQKLKSKFKNKRFSFLLSVLCLFLLLTGTNFYLLYLDMNKNLTLKDPDGNFLYKEDYVGLEWLKNHSKVSDVVFSDALYTDFVPIVSNRKTFFSANASILTDPKSLQKTRLARDFYFAMSKPEQKNFLKKNKIKFFFVGKKNILESDYGFWDKSGFLEKIYEEKGVKIYQVK